jgi:hypothetical protein
MTDDELRDAQDEVARLRETMSALGMTAPLPEDGPGAEPDADATAREIARIVALPRISEAPIAPAVPGAATTPAPDAPLDLAAARARRRRRWAVATSAAAAVVLVAAGLTVLPHRDEVAVATAAPPMLALPIDPVELAHGGGEPARDALLALAEAARDRPDPTPVGGVQHALSQSWLLSVQADDDGVTATIDPTIVESWLAPDGSSVQAEWRGDPLDADGSLEKVDTSPSAAAVDRLPAGTLDAGAVAALSTEPETLRRELIASMPGVSCTGDAEPYCLYSALTDLSDRYVVPSGTEAALWTVLADTPGVTIAGEVTDRIGRRSLAVAVPGNPVEADETTCSGSPSRP